MEESELEACEGEVGVLEAWEGEVGVRLLQERLVLEESELVRWELVKPLQERQVVL